MGGNQLKISMQTNTWFSGVGVGWMNYYTFIIIAVFISGLMVGRTPEFLGKKIEAREMKIATFVALLHPFIILVGTALSCYLIAHHPGYVSSEGGWLANPGFHEKTPRRIIRKAARLATRYNTSFIAFYVQTPRESLDRIGLARQRHLLNHFKLVTELGGEVMQVQSRDILGSIVSACKERQITTVCMGCFSFKLPSALLLILKYRKFMNDLSQANVDLIILA